MTRGLRRAWVIHELAANGTCTGVIDGRPDGVRKLDGIAAGRWCSRCRWRAKGLHGRAFTLRRFRWRQAGARSNGPKGDSACSTDGPCRRRGRILGARESVHLPHPGGFPQWLRGGGCWGSALGLTQRPLPRCTRCGCWWWTGCTRAAGGGPGVAARLAALWVRGGGQAFRGGSRRG